MTTVAELNNITNRISKEKKEEERVRTERKNGFRKREDIRSAQISIAVSEVKCLHAAEDGQNELEVWAVDYFSSDGRILNESRPECLNSPKLSEAIRMIIDHFRAKGFRVFVKADVDEENHDIQLWYICISW